MPERRFKLEVAVAGKDVSHDIAGRTFTARELEGLLIIKIPAGKLTNIDEAQSVTHPFVEMAEKENRFILFCGENEFPEIYALEIPPEMKEEE